MTKVGPNSEQTPILEMIAKLRPLLPIQNPMPFFVHNNPLQYWETEPFEKGMVQAVLTYENVMAIGSRHLWRDLEDFVIPLILSYFDQGLNRWSRPTEKSGLWTWFQEYVLASQNWKSPLLSPLKKTLAENRESTPIELIAKVLAERVPDRQRWSDHLQTLLFHFKGWSGMIQVLEKNPALFPIHPVKVELLDWVAVLVLSEAALKSSMKYHPVSICDRSQLGNRTHSIQSRLGHIREREFDYYRVLITRFKKHLANVSSAEKASTQDPKIQALFCIDDREESLRRAIEKINPDYETFGTVGFFGVDLSLRRSGQIIFQPQCPPVINPRKRAEEIVTEKKRTVTSFLRRLLPHLNESRFTPVEPLLAIVLWPVYFFALAMRSFFPGLYQRLRSGLGLRRQSHPAHSSIHFLDGYTIVEKADLVAGILKGAGLVKSSAKIVMVMGHAATTTNNPFQKSYGCGACSGQSGFVNARLFADFANDEAVRAELISRGIQLDQKVVFVAACHDTCSDNVEYAPIEIPLSPIHSGLIEKFKSDFTQALKLNASERIKQFHLKANTKTEDRALDWSQVRPEFGHTGVALAFFGPRALTKGLNLHRRAFLVSYDPLTDPYGDHLAFDLLNALPVCANINLDYFTSRAFPKALGAGSKLPLNIAAGIGLMPGSKGDLTIGLATQMVDQHQPFRLLGFVYCDAEKLQKAFARSVRLQNLIKNNWIHLIRIDPNNHEFQPVTEELSRELSSDK
jgi:uncharacterized protein YbcC (UPF0753/DUF2309 family)